MAREEPLSEEAVLILDGNDYNARATSSASGSDSQDGFDMNTPADESDDRATDMENMQIDSAILRDSDDMEVEKEKLDQYERYYSDASDTSSFATRDFVSDDESGLEEAYHLRGEHLARGERYTDAEEEAVVRMFDRRLVSFVAFLYMLSFLDRSNIGNARLAGLEIDLHLTSNRFEWCLTAFYITYIAFEWLSVLWRRIPAHIFLFVVVLSWGVIASLQAVQTSFAGLLLMRMLLGVGEAGFAGIPIFLSFFFKRNELALRTGYFISAAPLASTFASILAWVIMTLGHSVPIAPWRLLFLVEGFPAIFVAVIAFHVVPDSPAKATYLTPRQRRIAVARLRDDGTADEKTLRASCMQDLLATLRDPKSHLTALMLALTNISLASMPVFLPTIIQAMGHNSTISQALSAPPYVVAFLTVLASARISDRLETRSTPIIILSLLSAGGYLTTALAGHSSSTPSSEPLLTALRYAGIFPAAAGFFGVITLLLTWTLNNSESAGRKGWAFAHMQIVGQCGPLLGTRLYPRSAAPLYVRGLLACAAAMLGVAALAFVLRRLLERRNRRGDWARVGAAVGRGGGGGGNDDGYSNGLDDHDHDDEEEAGLELVPKDERNGDDGRGDATRRRSSTFSSSARRKAFIYML